MSQLPLGIALDDYALFETFYAGRNSLAVDALKDLRSPGAWIWGPRGCGKSHLAQAVAVSTQAPYLPLAELGSPRALDGLDQSPVLVFDDIDAVLGDEGWEHALFALYNSVAARHGCMLASAGRPPTQSEFLLPDLRSRFAASPVFRMRLPDDDERCAALMLRAERRGLSVSTRTIRYLIHHADRDMRSLYELLERLDRAALSAGRRLTLPLVRDFLRDEPSASRESAGKKR